MVSETYGKYQIKNVNFLISKWSDAKFSRKSFINSDNDEK